MFTGIVETVGTIRRIAVTRRGARLEVATRLARTLRPGRSVCVGGACLTVARAGRGTFAVDLVPETLRRTALGTLRPGDRVNLERSLRMGDRLDGHLVAGHVDGVGTVTGVRRAGNGVRLTVAVPRAMARYVAEKGSVALDGVSLTVAGLGRGTFDAALIPHTLARTTLGRLRRGDRVNLEADLLARYLERVAGRRKG